MSFELKETHLVFDNNVLKEVYVSGVLYDSTIYAGATRKRMSGYYSLKEYDIPTVTLFEKVAKTGLKLSKEQQNKYFPKHNEPIN